MVIFNSEYSSVHMWRIAERISAPQNGKHRAFTAV